MTPLSSRPSPLSFSLLQRTSNIAQSLLRHAWHAMTRDTTFIRAAAGLAVLVKVASVLSARLTFSPYSYDEQYFVWGGWSILRGLAPYRDFYDSKPPVLFLTEAAAVGLFGIEGQRFRLLFTLLALGSICAVYVGLVKRGVRVLLALGTTLLIVYYYLDPAFHDSSLNDVESIGTAYYFFGVSFMLLARRSFWRRACGSAFFTMCALTKEPFLLLVGPTWLAFLFDSPSGVFSRSFVPYLKASILGASGPVLFVLVYLIACGGLRDYIAQYPRVQLFANTYAVKIGGFVPGPFWSEQHQSWVRLNAVLYNLKALGPWLPLLGVGTLVARRSRWRRTLACILAVLGSAYAVTLGHCFWSHYFIMGIAGLAFCAVIACVAFAESIPSLRAQSALGAFVLFMLFPKLSERYEAAAAQTWAPAAPNVPLDVIEYVRQHTGRDDYILATQPGLYFFAERKSAVTYSSFVDDAICLYPGQTDEERLAWLASQIRTNRPKIVYVNPQIFQRGREHLNAVIMPFVAQNSYIKVQDGLYERPY
ncbi:MAG TPA: hypothetical protein VK540_20290 [Polyangiaceae bacterium]|jgi:hypothetical protein|nr:hypothetical protein [Polyangiaceae bacterium]